MLPLLAWGYRMFLVERIFGVADVDVGATRLVLEDDVQSVDDAGNVWDSGSVLVAGKWADVWVEGNTYNRGWSRGC
jgi:hypothetical protein